MSTPRTLSTMTTLALVCLALLCSPAFARAQATQNQSTLPSAPDLSQPTPTTDSNKTASGHPAPPSTTVPPSGVRPGSVTDKENSGIVILPYADTFSGTATLPPPPSGAAAVAAEASRDDATAQLLDRVVAVINGDVILASDVRIEQHFAPFEPYSVPGGEFTPLEAMRHIVNRTLILQQMNEQRMTSPPSDADVQKQLDELRKQIPACARYHCESDAGWHAFLAAQGFTVEQLQARWKQRMQILQFIQMRFRSGIRISKPEIEDYYNKTLVPQYRQRNVQPPPLSKISNRIDEVLLQQRVNLLLSDWLKTLKDAGTVAFLDPAYAQLGGKPAAEANDDETAPGGAQ